jgi:hypothetical protein
VLRGVPAVRNPRTQATPTTRRRDGTPTLAVRAVGVAVGVRGFNLNPVLRSYVLQRREAIAGSDASSEVHLISVRTPRRHRLRDRLSEQEVSTLVESFQAGTPAHVLAKRYGVGETALKALLRQRGVRRKPPQKLQQDEHQTG